MLTDLLEGGRKMKLGEAGNGPGDDPQNQRDLAELAKRIHAEACLAAKLGRKIHLAAHRKPTRLLRSGQSLQGFFDGLRGQDGEVLGRLQFTVHAQPGRAADAQMDVGSRAGQSCRQQFRNP